MDRKPLRHAGIFHDKAFAGEYVRKHWKMAKGFGERYGKKLRGAGFRGGRILDAGCGFGATNLALAHLFPQTDLVGIDLSIPLLDLGRVAAAEAGVEGRVLFQEADVMEIPFDDDEFDVVLNLNMVHLAEDPGRMLAELERVLKPRGFLFLADLRRSFLGILEREIKSAFTSPEARALIRKSPLRRGVFSSGILWWRYEALPGS